jgi:phosphatidylglycerol:prolipoprotein diacylglycerol transferase
LYVVFYGLIRAFVSSFRAEDLMLGGVRAPYVVSAVMILFAGSLIVYLRLWQVDHSPSSRPSRA